MNQCCHTFCIDSGGCKHVLGIREGASENKQVVMDLLTDMVERGVGPDRLRLFVIDGSKALRQAIDAVYGSKNPVQRCRNHKIRNVMDYLPEDQRDQVKSTMKAAFLLDADKGTAKLKQLAKWLEQEYPSAAASLLEGLDEMFTINRLGLPSSLRRCLATTNVIESPNGGIRSRTGRVKNWRDHAMVVRWVAASLLNGQHGRGLWSRGQAIAPSWIWQSGFAIYIHGERLTAAHPTPFQSTLLTRTRSQR